MPLDMCTVLPWLRFLSRSPRFQPSAEHCRVVWEAASLRGTTRSSAAGGVLLCAYLSTTFMLQSARAEPVAKQRWRAFSEHSLQGSHRLSQQSSSSEGLGLQGKRKSTKCSRIECWGHRVPPLLCPSPAPRAPQEQYLQLPRKKHSLSFEWTTTIVLSSFCPAFLLSHMVTTRRWQSHSSVISNTPTEVRKKKFIFHFWLSNTKR